VPVCRVENLNTAIEAAKVAGLWVVGLDEEAGEGLWSSELLDPPVVLVLGAEGKGIRPGVIDRLDGSVSIPQGGRIGSLNVAVAGAIAMFEVARRSGAGDRPE
jgi:23S rRNA (guanosine2251-2'-O)-methyltransferase